MIWTALWIAIVVPILVAGTSPLLAWRDPVYIIAGFGGIIAMSLLLVQPALVAGYMPGLSRPRARRFHRWIGGGLVVTVIIHVAGLWITSPPDVIDALLFVSPTPFAVWGVLAMWAVFAAALLAAARKRLRLSARTWRRAHSGLAAVIVVGSVVHAILIEGTMETMSKLAICALVLMTTAKSVADLRIWSKRSVWR